MPHLCYFVCFFTYLSDANRSTDWGHHYCADISHMFLVPKPNFFFVRCSFVFLVSLNKSHGLHGFTFGITLLTFLLWSNVTEDILQSYWQCLLTLSVFEKFNSNLFYLFCGFVNQPLTSKAQHGNWPITYNFLQPSNHSTTQGTRHVNCNTCEWTSMLIK